MTIDGITLFRQEMRTAGLVYSGPIIADGKLKRFKAEGDHKPNSWYVLHCNPPSAGAFGCWKRGIKGKWCERSINGMSKADKDAVYRQWEIAKREAENVVTERQTEAQKAAMWILSHSTPADTSHPYITRKAVGVHGDLHQRKGVLVLPLRDVDGLVHNLQFIAPNECFGGEGEKRDKTFLSGGRVAGCFFPVSDKAEGPLVICEGYATGASIHEATDYATVCAMASGNLRTVAEMLRAKWPEREIIITADSDQWTEGNPGLKAATEAANAVHARLAVPQFQNTQNHPTDFNDLHKQEGIDIVKAQIQKATEPAETDDQTLDRLAKLTQVEYDRCREAEANRLGIRIQTLDAERAKRQPKTDGNVAMQGCEMKFPVMEPWADTVDGANVLSEISDTFNRFIALPPGAADVLAFWCAHAHAFKAFLCSPRLNISSPVKGCGKTTLRDLVKLFVPRPMPTENMTVAVLFRAIAAKEPTVLADEYDTWLRNNEELRGMLNAGHRRGGKAYRCAGDAHEVREFNVFAPAVLCGIGTLPATLHDRSIVIRLERAKPGELIELFDSRRVAHEKELNRKIARFMADNSQRLESCDPILPAGIGNRLADNWRPLFAIAEITGSGWPQRLAAAFKKLMSREDSADQGSRTILLTDIRQVFADAVADKLSSAVIVQKLSSIEGRDWAEWGKNRQPITANQLAKELRGFSITPRNIKADGKVLKGYHLEDFQDAFARYLPPQGDSNRYPATKPDNKGGFTKLHTLPVAGGSVPESEGDTNVYADGSGVAGGGEGEALPEEEFAEAMLL